MEDSSTSKNPLSIPIAIVVAGALIAGAVFLSRGGSAVTNQSGDTTTKAAEATSQEISIKTVTAADHTIGNPEAPLSIVVYTDLECPFCKTFHSTMQKVADTYGKDGKVLWVYRHFPLEQLHPKAPKEAEATECAAELGGNQAFWDYTDKIFEITPSNNGLDPAQLPSIAKEIGVDQKKFDECLASGKYAGKVQSDYAEAVSAGGRGTPFSVIVSNTPISDSKINTIKDLTATLPPDVLTYSTDKRRISMSGALPLTLTQKILDTILAE